MGTETIVLPETLFQKVMRSPHCFFIQRTEDGRWFVKIGFSTGTFSDFESVERFLARHAGVLS